MCSDGIFSYILCDFFLFLLLDVECMVIYQICTEDETPKAIIYHYSFYCDPRWAGLHGLSNQSTLKPLSFGR